MLFLAVGTQWTVAPMGGYLGINYVSLESAMNMAGIKRTKRASMFGDVRIMESVALQVIRDKQK